MAHQPPTTSSANAAQPFRVMDLPAEIRQEIWRFALCPLVPRTKPSILVPGQRTMYLGRGDDPLSNITTICPPRTGPTIPPPSAALLRVSRQVHDEALSAAWVGPRHYFPDAAEFGRVVGTTVGPRVQFNTLGRIHLDLTHIGYFALFNVAVNSFRIRTPFPRPVTSTWIWPALPSLSDLRMDFRSPYTGSHLNFWFEDSCQKVLVDWILTFAFPHIRSINKIHLGGFIKTSTKAKWDRIFEMKSAGREHGHDSAAEIAAILATPEEDLPPYCYCTKCCFAVVTLAMPSDWSEFDFND